jgi:four helix bundle protein
MAMMALVPRLVAFRVAESYQDLLVWQKAIELATEVYRISREFPADERFGLTAQIRRAAVSIASNIAEGHGRHHTADYCRFLSFARGSAKEVETDLVIAERLTYVQSSELRMARSLADEISRMLSGLQRKLGGPGRSR